MNLTDLPLHELWTEPLTRHALSRYFGERRDTTRIRLKAMIDRGDARPDYGNKFRIRASEMPPKYFSELLVPIVQAGSRPRDGLNENAAS